MPYIPGQAVPRMLGRNAAAPAASPSDPAAGREAPGLHYREQGNLSPEWG